MKNNTIELGQRYIMPKPIESLADNWKYEGWIGEVVGFCKDYDLVTVRDFDGNCFDIETERLHDRETDIEL